MSYDIPRRKKGRSKKHQGPRKSVYEKQREEETIRNATERGYLRRMSLQFLNDNVGLNDCDLPTLGYLNVTKLQLSSVGALDMCVSLRICLLPGNYITSFDALIHCVNLIALDLHSNQIKNVPDDIFWASLTKLQFVYLHDNNISSLNTIKSISSSSSIMVLTLYDTPLSLKKNYRHHLVNGVWSLKVLDHHVVSDEEIIEDLSMSREFSSMNDKLRINLDHNLTKESRLQEAVEHFTGVLTQVNRIQGKFSPVLLIQKMIRGYLVRRKYKHIMSTRVWAATTIQRFYRFYKGIPQANSDSLAPPATTPLTNTMDGEALSDDDSTSQENQNMVSYTTSKASDSSALKIPSKTYQKKKQRRSEVGGFGDIAHTSLIESQDSGGVRVRKRMTIDLSKLQSSSLEFTNSSGSSDFKIGLQSSGALTVRKSDRTPKISRKSIIPMIETKVVEKGKFDTDEAFEKEGPRKKPPKIGKYQTVRVFLGSVEERALAIEEETSGFLLHGEPPPEQRNEPITDIFLTKKEMGRVTRMARECEHRVPEKKVIVKNDNAVTNDQKLFMRTHGTMGLACLRAVHQAYSDRAHAQKQAHKAERVAEMKERRDEMINKLRFMRMDYQENVLTDRIQEGVKIAEALRDNEIKQVEDYKKVAARRIAAVTRQRAQKDEMKFIRDFAVHQMSVSQALRAHDRAEIKRHKHDKLSEMVRSERETEMRQKALVKRYMEHRQLLLQADVSRARAALDMYIAEETKRQVSETEERMKERKQCPPEKEFRPVAPFNAPPRDKPLAIVFPGMSPVRRSTALSLEAKSSFNETPTSNSEYCSRDSSQLTL